MPKGGDGAKPTAADARLERLLAAKTAEAGAAAHPLPNGASEASGCGQQDLDPAPDALTPASGDPALGALTAAATQYGAEAFRRQMETMAALSKAKTPEEMLRIQTEYGRSALETYLAHSRRVSEVLRGPRTKKE